MIIEISAGSLHAVMTMITEHFIYFNLFYVNYNFKIKKEQFCFTKPMRSDNKIIIEVLLKITILHQKSMFHNFFCIYFCYFSKLSSFHWNMKHFLNHIGIVAMNSINVFLFGNITFKFPRTNTFHHISLRVFYENI